MKAVLIKLFVFPSPQEDRNLEVPKAIYKTVNLSDSLIPMLREGVDFVFDGAWKNGSPVFLEKIESLGVVVFDTKKNTCLRIQFSCERVEKRDDENDAAHYQRYQQCFELAKKNGWRNFTGNELDYYREPRQ
jgi:hypothetical protein